MMRKILRIIERIVADSFKFRAHYQIFDIVLVGENTVPRIVVTYRPPICPFPIRSCDKLITNIGYYDAKDPTGNDPNSSLDKRSYQKVNGDSNYERIKQSPLPPYSPGMRHHQSVPHHSVKQIYRSKRQI